MRQYSIENWGKVYESEEITIFENPKDTLHIKGYKGKSIYPYFNVRCCNSKIKDGYIDEVKRKITNFGGRKNG